MLSIAAKTHGAFLVDMSGHVFSVIKATVNYSSLILSLLHPSTSNATINSAPRHMIEKELIRWVFAGDPGIGWKGMNRRAGDQIGEHLMKHALLWSGFGWSEVGYETQETSNMLL